MEPSSEPPDAKRKRVNDAGQDTGSADGARQAAAARPQLRGGPGTFFVQDPAAVGPGSEPSPAHASLPGPACPDEAAAAVEIYQVPAYAGWFRWDKIHPLERRELPEIFASAPLRTLEAAPAYDGESKRGRSPELYLEYRNSIINLYRAAPEKALSFTQVRRCLVGDVVLLRRIFTLLSHWGLINSLLPLAHTIQGSSLPDPAPTAKGSAVGEAISLVSPSPAHPAGRPSSGHSPAALGAGRGGAALGASLEQTRAVLAADAAVSAALGAGKTTEEAGDQTKEEELPSVTCNTCSGVCSSSYYTAVKKEDCHLCASCFGAGQFCSGLSELDFALVVRKKGAPGRDQKEAPAGLSGAEADGDEELGECEWTEEELLLLLEAVDKYAEDWAQVAAHVGTKTAQQCVLHFIRLPIHETVMDEQRLHALHSTLGDSNGGGSGPKLDEAAQGSTEDGQRPNGVQARRPLGSSPLVVPFGGLFSGTDSFSQMPFHEYGNPVMAQMAFLAAMLGTRVVSDAAQAALAALAVDDPSGLEQLRAVSQQEVARARRGAAAQGSAAGAERVPGEQGSATQAEQTAAGRDGMDAEAKLGSSEGQTAAPEVGPDWGSLRNRAACAAAFAAAAVKAKLLAEEEEHHMRSLLTKAVEWQLKKVGLKLAQFYKMEKLFENEAAEVNAQNQQIFAERVRLAAKEKSFIRGS